MFICMSILLYADDILLVAPSVTALQRLLLLCEQELMWLDMSLNVKQEAQLMLTTGSTRLAVSRGQQTWYHSTCNI